MRRFFASVGSAVLLFVFYVVFSFLIGTALFFVVSLLQKVLPFAGLWRFLGSFPHRNGVGMLYTLVFCSSISLAQALLSKILSNHMEVCTYACRIVGAVVAVFSLAMVVYYLIMPGSPAVFVHMLIAGIFCFAHDPSDF